ncbi:hypothetical protein B0H14DRAFT_3689455 [Mycena olivaceomarginata]|nr:hypothetical protein B0H14DRAFT_3689455 [Mycena olivaceomarginata]
MVNTALRTVFTNPDLFWALRGGGGSTFGIVLESTFLAEPRMRLQVASISFNRKATNYQPFLRLLVDESYKWGTEGWGGHMAPTNIISVNPLLTTEQAIESLKNVTKYVQAQNGTVVIEELGSILHQLFTNEAGQATLTNTMVQMIQEYNINPYIVVGTPFLFDGLDNATSVTPAWRHALWQIDGHDGWQWNSSLLRDLRPDSGAYFNEGDLYETDHEESFWGPNYPALLSIKRK